MYKDIDDVEEAYAKAKKIYIELEEQLSVDGLSKQEKGELKVKRKALVKDLMVLEKILALENKTTRNEGGENRKWIPYSTKKTATFKIIGYLMFQFMLLIFQIVSLNKAIGAIAVYTSIVFLIISILTILLARKSNRPMWTENKEKIEKTLFKIIILLTIVNLLLGVIILIFS